jgi:hypothetical protein
MFLYQALSTLPNACRHGCIEASMDLRASPFHTASQKLGSPTDMIDRKEEKTLSYITLDTTQHQERA